MSLDPHFSVLLSLYDREKPEYLDACLQSIESQILKADEIVLVLDGPINPSLREIVDRWCARLPIKLVPLAVNVGLGRALDAGLSECKHDLVCRMDTDDICVPERFAVQVPYMLKNASLSICGSDIDEIDPVTEEFIGVRSVPKSSSNINRWAKFRNPFNHMSVVYRRADVLKSGGYQDFLLMEDYYLWLRMISKGFKGENLERSLVRARTGKEMLIRRRGLNYFRREWALYLAKHELGMTGWIAGFFVFLLRSIPRLMPNSLLLSIYEITRSKKSSVEEK